MTRRRPGYLSLLIATWAVLVVWTLLSHPGDAARLETVRALVLAAGSFVLAAALGAQVRWLPGALLAAGLAAFLLGAGPRAWSGGAAAPPLDYGNANGMLVVAAVAGALLAATVVRRRRWQLLAGAVALAGIVASAEMRAKAALLACALLLAWFALHRLGGPLRWVVTAVVGTAVSWAATVVLALHPAAAPGVLVATLSPERFRLWRDALRITADNPLLGSGPGSFPRLSVTAQDPDLAWTHSTPLQFSAELGVIGLLLFALLVATLLAQTGRWSVAVAVVLLPTTIDYVLDFPSVVLAVSFVAGSAWSLAGAEARSDPVAGTGKPTLTPPGP